MEVECFVEAGFDKNISIEAGDMNGNKCNKVKRNNERCN